MDQIPPEIADNICAHLSISELMALSKQSRRWAWFTRRLRFASLRIVFCEPHLQWLRFIVEDTNNAEFVQQLNIYANVVPQYANIKEYQWAIEMDGVITTDEAERRSGFQRYQRTFSRHITLRDSFSLKEIVNQLPNLQRVMVSSGSVCGCVSHRPFRFRSLGPNSRVERLYLRDVSFLKQVRSIRLKSFTLENLDWECCFLREGMWFKDLLQPWIAQVDHLSLTFVTRFIQAETSESAGSTRLQFRERMREGPLKKLVDSGAANLQNFELYFLPSGIFGNCRLDASIAIPAQKLRRLVLTNVSFSLPMDNSRLALLGQTLECLELKDIQSNAGPVSRRYGYMYDTWGVRALFHLFVRDFHLKEARFRGHFWTYGCSSPAMFLDLDINAGSSRNQTVGHQISRLVVRHSNPELSETENGLEIEHRISLIDQLFKAFRRDRHRCYWVHVQKPWWPDEAMAEDDGFPGIITKNMKP